VPYLEAYRIEQTQVVLAEDERIRLARLFVAAYDSTRKPCIEDCLLQSDSRIYALLRHNYPELEGIPQVEGSRVFLGDVAGVLRGVLDDDCSGRVRVAGFGVPEEFFDNHEFHPLSYLEAYCVEDTRADLSGELKESLARLFVAAHEACSEKYGQDYLLPSDTRLLKLLEHNYPEVGRVPRVKIGRAVFLGDIAAALRNREVGDRRSDPAP
jgi:hypothetical protein